MELAFLMVTLIKLGIWSGDEASCPQGYFPTLY